MGVESQGLNFMAEDHSEKPGFILPGEYYKMAQEYLTDNG
jgi:hypothetical protein